MLLTIAIPTFNRPDELNKRIGELSLLPEITASQIELLICDNSKDPFNLPSELLNLRIKYVKNVKNVGLGRNINSCLLNASGKFVWLCSDDDTILPNSIAKLVDLLARTESDVIALGDEVGEESVEYSNPRIDRIPRFWSSFIFISSCIYRVESVQKFLRHQSHLKVNPTYQQVLIALGMFGNGSKLECWKNIFVIDTLTHKNYSVRSAYVVRIFDLIKLERDLLKLQLSPVALENLSELIDSHILNYIPSMVFEYFRRRDFFELFRLTIESFAVSRHYLRRDILLIFGIILAAISILDCRFSRLCVKMLEKAARKNLVKFTFRDILIRQGSKISVDASSIGYEGQ